MNRKISKSTKEDIAKRQAYRCANVPGKYTRGLEGYQCPLWDRRINQGMFGASGYEIDHIIEVAEEGSDHESNLQALCKRCHREKTSRFNRMNYDRDNFDVLHRGESHYARYNCNQLKYICKSLALYASGKKQNMIKRIVRAYPNELFIINTNNN
jgi:hypothetical protein